MRVAILTLDGYLNYGNILQRYALQMVLLHYASTVDTVWHSKDNFLPRIYWQWSWKQAAKIILNWRGFRTQFFNGHNGREIVRQAKIKEFCDRYVHIRYDVEDLRSIADEYDFFVVGSDQVWNPHGTMSNGKFLSFAPSGKRISYAASIACPEIPKKNETFYREGLSGMKTLSLREHEGATLVEQLIGRKAEVHVDPTLLLGADEWRKVSRVPAWYRGGEYLLTYFLGQRPAVVDKVAKELGLPVVNMLDENVFEHYTTGVDEFLWLIEHASLVYTDSFHGTIFSILFRRPFVVCDRMGSKTTEQMGSRIDTLLGYFGLENRHGTAANGYRITQPLLMPDWAQVESVLMREKSKAMEYLKMALEK